MFGPYDYGPPFGCWGTATHQHQPRARFGLPKGAAKPPTNNTGDPEISLSSHRPVKPRWKGYLGTKEKPVPSATQGQCTERGSLRADTRLPPYSNEKMHHILPTSMKVRRCLLQRRVFVGVSLFGTPACLFCGPPYENTPDSPKWALTSQNKTNLQEKTDLQKLLRSAMWMFPEAVLPFAKAPGKK